jgi:hypothetical protein
MPFVAGNKKNIIVGAAALFIGPSYDGTGSDPAPAVSGTTSYRETVSDDVAWRNVGYTSDGMEVSNDPSYTDVEVDQLLDAAKIFKDSMGMSVNTTLAEATLENLLVAWGQAENTISSAAQSKTLDLAGGALGEAPVERGLIAVGNATEKAGSNAYGERTYKVHRVLSVESSAHSLARADATNLPVSFRCLPASSGSYGYVRDRFDVA